MTAEEVEKLRNWDFNILFVPALHDKFRYVLGMFSDLNLFTHVPLDAKAFTTFVYNLSLHYDQRTNPFHNFNHGITGNQYNHFIISSF